jgi:hypothetical protein
MRAKTNLLDWIDYLQHANPATPYLSLFKNLVAIAYAYLGGGEIDQAAHSARRTFDIWQAEQIDGVREGFAEQTNPREALLRAGKPVPDRDGFGARREVVRCGHARRVLYERAAGNVARMFFDVLGYHAFNRTDTLELTEPLPAPPPEDPDKLKAIESRAQYLRVFLDPQPIAEQPLPDLSLVRERISAEMELRHLKARNAGQQAEIDRLGRYINHRLDVVAPDAAAAKGQSPGETREAGNDETDQFMLAVLQADEKTFATLSPGTQELIGPARQWMQKAIADGMPHDEACEAVMQELRKQINPNTMRMAKSMANRRGVLK